MTKLTKDQEYELIDAVKTANGVVGSWLATEDFNGRAISGLEKKGFVGMTSNRKQFVLKQEAIDYVSNLA